MLIKIKAIWKEYKRELVVGIIVSLVTAVIIQVGDWFVMTAPTMGNSLLETIKNFVFASAATQSSLRILSTIISCILSFFVSYYLVAIIKSGSIFREEHKIKKLKKRLEQVLSGDAELEEKTELELLKLSQDSMDNEDVRHEKNVKNLKRMLVLATFSTVFLVIYAFLFLIIPLGLVDRFQRDITAITPYSDNCTIQRLESDWVCMRSENEYKEIYIMINEIKQEYNLP